MPQTKVRTPGGIVTVNHPEGATEQQILAFARRQHKPSTPKPAQESTLASRALNALGINSPFARGLGDSRAFGFADEAGAVLDTLGIGGSGEERPNIWKGDNPIDAWRYNQRRNAAQMAESQQEAPGEFMSGQITGAVLPGPSSKVVGATRAGRRVQQAGRAIAAAPKSRVGQAAARAAVAAAPDVARGAVYGVGSAEGDIGERVSAAPTGAAQGLAGHAVGKTAGATVARAFRGANVPPNVRKLAGEGVVMTPGRRGGPIARVYEEGVLGSIPFVKSIPAAANRRSIEQLNVAFYNRVLKPIGRSVPRDTRPGKEAIEGLANTVYDNYDNATSALRLGMDNGLNGAVNSLKMKASGNLGPLAKDFANTVDAIVGPLHRGSFSGGRVRTLLSDLRGKASRFAQSQDAYQQNMGDELWRLHDLIESAMLRQNKGGAVDAFKKARESVRLLKRVESAAATAADGVANPTQLRAAVTRRGYGVTTAKVAQGKAPMQDLADAAKQVLPATIPNSGTPERAIGTALLASGPGSVAGAVDPTMGVLAGSHLFGYVPGVDRWLQNFALNRPAPMTAIGNIIDQASPALGTAGTMTALGYSR